MWKYLAILAVIAFAPICVSGQPNQAGGDKNKPSDKSQAAPATTYTYQSNCCTTQTSPKTDEESFQWYTSIKRPEWWLVILGFPTLFIVGWQAFLMRQHASHFKELAQKTADAVTVAQKDSTFSNRAYVGARIDKWMVVTLPLENVSFSELL
jgi:hypothetical protein